MADGAMPTPESHPRQWAVFSQVPTGCHRLSVTCCRSVSVARCCVQLDADGSGTLDVEEIFEYVRAPATRRPCTPLMSLVVPCRIDMQLADMDENIANELMSVLDQNGDGEVDFEEFCNGWERIFIVGGQGDGDEDASSQQDATVVDDEEAAAAATVQSHFRGHQARKEVAFRKQLRDQRAEERRLHGDGEWDSTHIVTDRANAAAQDDEDDYVQPLHGHGQELEDLDAARQRQAQQVSEAAALRRAQELELEAEAMAREEAYLNRMRDGLVRRGMLGSAASRGSRASAAPSDRSDGGGEGDVDAEARALEDYEAEVDATAAAAMGKKTPSQLMPSAKEALSLKIGPLTTPNPGLKADEMIRWGGPAGIRLVLRHNLRQLAESELRHRSTLL